MAPSLQGASKGKMPGCYPVVERRCGFESLPCSYASVPRRWTSLVARLQGARHPSLALVRVVVTGLSKGENIQRRLLHPSYHRPQSLHGEAPHSYRGEVGSIPTVGSTGNACTLRLTARTLVFQSGNTGPTPVGCTKSPSSSWPRTSDSQSGNRGSISPWGRYWVESKCGHCIGLKSRPTRFDPWSTHRLDSRE